MSAKKLKSKPQTDSKKWVRILKKRFLNRRDRLSVAAPWNGKPCPASTDELEKVLMAHLEGDEGAEVPVTFHTSGGDESKNGRFRAGAYALSKKGKCKWLCIDVDGIGHSNPVKSPMKAVRRIIANLKELQITPLIEKSGGGKGWHIWVLFENPQPAAFVRALGFKVVPNDVPLANGEMADPTKSLGIEIFPKHNSLGKGNYGTAMWLPLWGGAKGKRCRLFEEDLKTVSTSIEVPLVTADAVAALKEKVPPLPMPVRKSSSTKMVARDASEIEKAQRLALQLVPLDEVVGPWLTGKRNAAGWLEARDPESETGDENPSANFADSVEGVQRGLFKSFRDERTMSLVNFLVQYNAEMTYPRAWELIAKHARISLDTGRPQIPVNKRQLREIVADMAKVFALCNIDKPEIFRDRDNIYTVRKDKNGAEKELVTNGVLSALMIEKADFYKINAQGEMLDTKHDSDATKVLLSVPPKELPVLKGVVSVPVFLSDGTLVSEPGYHEKAEIVYYPAQGWDMPAVSKRPTEEEVQAAVDLIFKDLFVDFPFSGAADRAHALAALLLPFARQLFQGCAPLHVIDASTPGTGKSLLCELISIVVTGKPSETTTLPKNDEEVGKKFTAELMRGRPMFVIDNVDFSEKRLNSANFASALTAEIWNGRQLGHTKTLTMPNHALWMLTGNNARFSNELSRRVIPCRLEAKMERPWERKEFKHSEIGGWARRHRPELVHAVLTIIQNWIAGGMKKQYEVSLGSFEAWARTIGGIINAAGVEGFLKNLTEYQLETNEEAAFWARLLPEWFKTYGEELINASKVVELCEEEGLFTDFDESYSDLGSNTSMGMRLQSQAKCVYDGLQILPVKQPNGRVKGYRLKRVDEKGDEKSDTKGGGVDIKPLKKSRNKKKKKSLNAG